MWILLVLSSLWTPNVMETTRSWGFGSNINRQNVSVTQRGCPRHGRFPGSAAFFEGCSHRRFGFFLRQLPGSSRGQARSGSGWAKFSHDSQMKWTGGFLKIGLPQHHPQLPLIFWLVVKKPSWKMMEFVNGKDDIPYMKWKIIQMFQTTNQF